MGKVDEKVGFARGEAEAADRQILAERLREAREYVGLSQEEVATYLRVPRTAVTNMEAGQRRVDALELKNLAQLYKRSVGYFTGESEIERDLPKDVAVLARAAAGLSDQDQEELRRFAEYLRSRSQAEGSRNG
jgi:transcriptional regulator with XRE-family HTH domain